jgi:uncharacterized protein (DUF983 family)
MKTKDFEEEKETNGRFWWRSEEKTTCQRAQPMPGDPCPHCQEGTLVFNGLLMLLCDKCQKVADYGGFT